MVPDCGATHFVPRLVGRARATGMFMLGERLGAEDAAEWGLIWQCVDDQALMATARALARRLAARPTRALGYTKRLINASAASTLDEQLHYEYELQLLAGRTADYREGVRAFMEKRKPRFKGR